MKNLYVIFLFALTTNFFVLAQEEEKDSVHYFTLSEARSVPEDEVHALDLSKMRLSFIPNEIVKYKNLRHLNLYKNKIAELPDFIVDFKHLIDLNLGKNQFSIYPSILCKISSLRFLSLNQNKFSLISDCISNLTELEYIDLWDTPIETFPNAFLTMRKLKEIDMRGVIYGFNYQRKWTNQLNWMKINFDAPCDCMDK